MLEQRAEGAGLGTPSPGRPLRPAASPLAGLADDLRLDLVGDATDVRVTGVVSRAQDVRPGDLFAALPGRAVHGAAFAHEAARSGAVAVLTDERGVVAARAAGLPVLVAADPRRSLGAVAARVHRGAAPALLGVTGTNGKTTTAHLVEHLLERLGVRAGVSSTAEQGSGDERSASRLTTPEADELHALLARMGERGVEAAAVEVSAQALVRSRVEGLVFAVTGFTNLTHDHLDDFGTPEAYLAAKARLFEPGVSRSAVVCVDSAGGRRLAAGLRVPAVTLASDPGVPADWRVTDVTTGFERTAFTLTGPDGRRLRAGVRLLGAHQAVDAALAILMVVAGGRSFEAVAAELARADLAPSLTGRLERVPATDGPTVHLDVAHTPDAIAKGLAALRPLTRGRLVVLFGADGDRDATKRGPMGRTAAELADLVIVHDHHSRFEDPDRIRAMVLDGARGGPAEVLEIRDPADAIRHAVRAAGADGGVLWAGTGRTAYRDVRGTKHPWSFWDEARAAVAEVRAGR